MTRQKIDWLYPSTPESLLMLDDPIEGLRPKWLPPGALGQVLQIDALGRLAWGPTPSGVPLPGGADDGDVLTLVDGEPAWMPLPEPPDPLTWPLLAPNGSLAAASYSFASKPRAGMWWDPSGQLVLNGDFDSAAYFSANDAVSVGLFLQCGPNALSFGTDGSEGWVEVENGLPLTFYTAASGRWQVLPTGHLRPLVTNVYDLGDATHRVRNLYLTGGLAIANPMTAAGDLIRGGASGVATRLPVGTDGHVLTLAAGVPGWAALPAPPAAGMANPMTTLGDLILGGVGGAPGRLAIGAEARVLQVSAGAVSWQPLPPSMANPMTTKGDLIIGDGPAADPAFVNAVTGGGTPNNASTSIVITVGAGANYLLYIASNFAYGPSFTSTLSSVTANRTGGGPSLTFTPIVNGVNDPGNPGKKLFIWGSPAVAGAEYTVLAAWLGNLDVAHSVSAFSGVNAGTPFGTPVTDLDGGTTGSLSVDAGTRGLIVDAMTDGPTSVYTPGGGQTALHAAVVQGSASLRASCKVASGVTGMTMTTTSGSGDSAYAGVALLIGTGALPGTPIRLGIGTAAQVLTALGGVPTWAAPAGPTFPMLAPDGTAAAPSYSFAGATGSGMYRPGGRLAFTAGGGGLALGGSAQVILSSFGILAFATGQADSAALEFGIQRDGANTLALRGITPTTSPTTFRLYNTFTDAANGEWLDFKAAAGSFFSVRAIANGTGVGRDIRFMSGDNLGSSVIIPALSTSPVALGQSHVSGAGGQVSIAGAQVAVAGTSAALRISSSYAPTLASTLGAIPLYLTPLINYAAGGAGTYEVIKIAVTETALPTGACYMIRASGGAAGNTDVFRVTNAGQVWVPDGSISAPSYCVGSTTIGMFRSSTFTLGFALGSSEQVRIGSANAGVATLTLRAIASPGDAFLAAGSIVAPDLFFYRIAAAQLGLRGLGGTTGVSINMIGIAAPTTPATGQGLLYMKADKKLYFKDDAGLETALW